jgi:uncharacterized protein (DUF2132 family)
MRALKLFNEIRTTQQSIAWNYIEIHIRVFKTYGWHELGGLIKINCFNTNPTIKSSLTFLRKTPWAREKVESLYLKTIKK